MWRRFLLKKVQSKKIRRVTKFDEKIATSLLAKIAGGQSVRKICAKAPFPTRETFYRWIRENENFAAKYIEAKDLCADALAEEILEIADEAENDFSVIETEKGKEYRANGAKLERAKIRIDARKWTASKLAPKKYGNNLKVESDNKHTGEMKIIFENYGGADDADC
jgi:hypothetical protein